MRINDEPEKRTGNEPETKLPNLLKIKEEPKKRTGNEPENEAGHVTENKGAAKKRTGNEPELRLPALTALPAAGISPATCAAPPAARFHNPSLLG